MRNCLFVHTYSSCEGAPEKDGSKYLKKLLSKYYFI